jgi:signal transduction histidine kinase
MRQGDTAGLTFTNKLRWLIIAAPCLVLFLTVYASHRAGMIVMEARAEEEAGLKITAVARRVSDFFDRAVILCRTIAARQEALNQKSGGRRADEDTVPIFRRLIETTPPDLAQGVYLAFEERDPETHRNVIQWVDRNYQGTKLDLGYDFHDNDPNREWYWAASKSGPDQVNISEPYLDQGGSDAWLVSVTQPVFDAEGKFMGVAGVDVEMKSITAAVASIMKEVAPAGAPARRGREYAYLVSPKGKVFAVPGDVRDRLGLDRKSEVFALDRMPAGNLIRASDECLTPLTLDSGGARHLLFWKAWSMEDDADPGGPGQNPSKRWKIVLSVPEQVVFADSWNASWTILGIGLAGLVLMVGIVAVVADRVTRPIGALAAAAKAVEAGDYQPNGLGAVASRSDEFGLLARGFRAMVKQVSAREAELRRTEDEIRQLNAGLDHRVRLRTAELEQTLEELRGAKEAAELAMKRIEEFATGVAHDMRNLLMIIIGYGEDLLRRAVKKQIDAFIPDLKLIASKGNELIELLNDLLTQSKAMSGKGVVLDLEEFDVALMVRERMEGIELIAQKNGNTVELRAGDHLGTMVADKVKVCRILMNLMTNACKFTRSGTITLTATRVPSDGSDKLRFEVADTGIGMAPAQVEKLFDRFTQVHDHTEHKAMGFGLGLVNCMLYCKAMGGEIHVASVLGRGTTFTVSLPAVVKPPEADAVRPAARPPLAGPDDVGPATVAADGKRSDNLVLIIDDDDSISALVQRNLDDEGYQTLTAHSGEEGLRLAKQTLPAAIVLDLVMPGIDGWAVLAALKTDEKTAGIPIIMASILEERERGMRMGANAFVNKPFTRQRLATLLQKHLRGPLTLL